MDINLKQSNAIALNQFFNKIRKQYQTPKTQRTKGTLFERLVYYYLKRDIAQQNKFSNVYEYSDWAKKFPDKQGKDTGVDLVAEVKLKDDQSEFWAIQCKFYQEDTKIGYNDVSTFFNEVNTIDEFKGGIIVDTTKKDWSIEIDKILKRKNHKSVSKIKIANLIDSNINWKEVFEDEQQNKPWHKHVEDPTTKLRYYQEDAVAETLAYFQTHERGKLIMACGTGKTITAFHIAQKFAVGGG